MVSGTRTDVAVASFRYLSLRAGGRSPRKEDSPATYLPKVFFGEISNLTAGLRHFG